MVMNQETEMVILNRNGYESKAPPPDVSHKRNPILASIMKISEWRCRFLSPTHPSTHIPDGRTSTGRKASEKMRKKFGCFLRGGRRGGGGGGGGGGGAPSPFPKPPPNPLPNPFPNPFPLSCGGQDQHHHGNYDYQYCTTSSDLFQFCSVASGVDEFAHFVICTIQM